MLMRTALGAGSAIDAGGDPACFVKRIGVSGQWVIEIGRGCPSESLLEARASIPL